jgi:ribosome-associated toxin RatA of RatAB toxin-antitoxin module
MRDIQLEFFVADRSSLQAYEVVRDFARYPDLCPAVRSVEILEADSSRSVSRWEVNFRKGILRWVEEDLYDDHNTRIEFAQTQGDIAVFEGSWDCAADGKGAAVAFRARLDMGVPTLADALEPIAVRALVDNIEAIVDGLFPGALLVTADQSPALAATGRPS